MANNIPTRVTERTQAAYTSWDDQASFTKASAQYNRALANVMPISRGSDTLQTAKGAIANRFQNIDGPTSVRDAFSRLDYEFFRPNEQLPKRFRDIIFACNGAYQKIAIIREVIDLMGDFGSQGIRLVHPNKSIERFYQTWFKQINGVERTERLLNYLYRMGNVVTKRSTGKLKQETIDSWKRAQAKSKEVIETDLEYKDEVLPGKYEIPLRYTFLNPIVLEVIGEEIAAFTGRVHYALKLPMNFYRSLNLPLTSFDPALLTEELPRDIQGALDNNDRYLILDPAKLITCFYKKDDWDVWSYPMLYSLLDDLILFQKMKLADLTALDGVISHVRIWKLGSLEHKIFPTDAAIQKLSSILLNHTAGGAIDLIWGPDLVLDETKTDVYKFLGGEKYEGVMAHIHQGLGLGSIGSEEGGFSKTAISSKVLIERLKYGRSIASMFWDGEIKLVQQAMGFRYPAQVVYDNMNLHEEVAEKALWLQAVDRDLVSIESFQEKFGQIPEIENIRIKRQYKEIENKSMPPRVSPYHDAQPNLSKEKIFAQRGVVTPSQIGLDLPKAKQSEKNAVELQGEQQIKVAKEKPAPIGVAGKGRPRNKKDSTKRKTRTTKPRSTAETIVDLSLHATKLQKLINDEINPYFLEKFSKASHDSGCLMVPLTADMFGKIQNWSDEFIPDENLYTEQDEQAKAYDNYGREERPHVTIVYGFGPNLEKDIRKFVEGINPGEVTFTLGDVSKFDQPNYDVIKISVESEQLDKLHDNLVEEFNVNEKYKEYQPHVTIAYVKKGTCDHLVGAEAFAGIKLTSNTFTYSEGEMCVELTSKKNLRMLTEAQRKEMEEFKFHLLFNIQPDTVTTAEDLSKVLAEPFEVYPMVTALYKQMVADFITKYEAPPTYKDLEQIKALAYAAFHSDIGDEEE